MYLICKHPDTGESVLCDTREELEEVIDGILKDFGLFDTIGLEVFTVGEQLTISVEQKARIS